MNKSFWCSYFTILKKKLKYGLFSFNFSSSLSFRICLHYSCYNSTLMSFDERFQIYSTIRVSLIIVYIKIGSSKPKLIAGKTIIHNVYGDEKSLAKICRKLFNRFFNINIIELPIYLHFQLFYLFKTHYLKNSKLFLYIFDLFLEALFSSSRSQHYFSNYFWGIIISSKLYLLILLYKLN